jgi:hypothetical protein
MLLTWYFIRLNELLITTSVKSYTSMYLFDNKENIIFVQNKIKKRKVTLIVNDIYTNTCILRSYLNQ